MALFGRVALWANWAAREVIANRNSGVNTHKQICRRICGNSLTAVQSTPLNNEDSFVKQSDLQVDSATYGSLLRWCGNQKALADGKFIHGHIIGNGLEQSTFLGNLLVQMYGKCGDLESALALFARMLEHTSFSWNFIIRACTQQGQCQMAILLFNQMQQEGTMPDKFTFTCALSACASQGELIEAKKMHSRIVSSEIESDIAVGTAMVNMYGNCGSPKDALEIFDSMPEHDVVTWNAVISVYSQYTSGKQAFQSFKRMQQEGIMPNRVTFVAMLDAFASHAELDEGEQMHVHILGSGLDSDVMVGNAIVNMYGKCGSLDAAWMMFYQMPEWNVVSWTTMIASCVQHKQTEEAFQLFNQMLCEGILPGSVTFVSILSACGSYALIAEGEQIHARMVEIDNIVVGTALINMYGRCGSIENAKKMFHRLPEHDIVAWNAMVSIYAQHGEDQEAVQLFYQMEREGVPRNSVTFISVLAACASLRGLVEGRRVHACIVDSGFGSNVLVGNALVNMYGKCGSLEDAWKTFSRMPKWDVVSWNAMIAIFALHGSGKKALAAFDQMHVEGVIPDSITFISVLEVYANYLVPTKDVVIHPATLDIEYLSVVGNACISKQEKSSIVENARSIFDDLNERDVKLWNAMATVYVQHDEGQEALLLFHKMQQEGVLPNNTTFITVFSASASQLTQADGRRIHSCIVNSELESDLAVGTALVSMYGKCGCVADAGKVFGKITDQNVVSWTAMISVFAQNGLSEEALKAFIQMQQNSVLPNNVTFASVLIACASQAAVDEGKRLHAAILGVKFESDVIIQTALIHMYARCGSLQEARSYFDQVSEHDVILWNTMITMYAQHGLGEEACKLFNIMQERGVTPDKVTFVSILTACSHSGLVDEGFRCFNSMIRDHSVSCSIEHCVCIIDLLGRVGRLDEAESWINAMPYQPSGVPFMALLGACRHRVDLKRGEQAAVHVFELDPGNAAPYILLSNMYARGHAYDTRK